MIFHKSMTKPIKKDLVEKLARQGHLWLKAVFSLIGLLIDHSSLISHP